MTRHLRNYWLMEGANVLLIPSSVVIIVLSCGGKINLSLLISLLACSALLVVGTIYWYAIWHRVEGRGRVFEKWLPRLASVELCCAALVCLSAALLIMDFWHVGGKWPAQRTATLIMTIIAALEYLNYYKIQLQHFDNPADFQRLLSGKGFRKAHLARDIAVWRRTRLPLNLRSRADF